MGATCHRCGADLVGDARFCARCGAAVRRSGSVVASLPMLRPEAEPPLPAEHEALRANRTPGRGESVPTRVEKLMTPARVVAPSPLLGVKAMEAIEPALPSVEVPSLTDGRKRTGLVVVLVLLAVGATVGWLLSRDPPPTADEVRANGAQQHPR